MLINSFKKYFKICQQQFRIHNSHLHICTFHQRIHPSILRSQFQNSRHYSDKRRYVKSCNLFLISWKIYFPLFLFITLPLYANICKVHNNRLSERQTKQKKSFSFIKLISIFLPPWKFAKSSLLTTGRNGNINLWNLMDFTQTLPVSFAIF